MQRTPAAAARLRIQAQKRLGAKTCGESDNISWISGFLNVKSKLGHRRRDRSFFGRLTAAK